MSEEVESQRSLGLLGNRPAIILAVISLIFLTIICIFAYLLFIRDDGVVDVDLTTIPTTDVTPEFVSSQRPVLQSVTGSETVSITLDLPVSMRLGGRDFTVTPQTVNLDGSWNPSVQGEGTAVWVYGTVINYVLGLPFSDENRSILEQLQPGSEMTLITESGSNFTFALDNLSNVPASNQSIFLQNQPGVTVALLGAPGGDRLVAHGTYIVPQASDNVDLGNVIELGEPAQLETVQLTVSGATYIPDRPEAPPGFAFYVIDYQIQNTGLTAFDISQLQFLLVDQFGTQYVRSPQASQLGNFGALTEPVNANQVMQASIGYQVPLGLVSPSLNWIVRHTETGSEIQVTIPFSASGNAAQATSITLLSAEASADLTSIILVGSVLNLGEQPVVVSERDITLTTDDGSVYLLLSTNPAFPWSISPGQTGQFTVVFQRPASSTAVFTVLNQSFQLSGLR